jgi:hypothetical protein
MDEIESENCAKILFYEQSCASIKIIYSENNCAPVAVELRIVDINILHAVNDLV